MTKQEIVNELAKHGVDATTRARKAVLMRLLDEVRADAVNEPDTAGIELFTVVVAGALIGTLVGTSL